MGRNPAGCIPEMRSGCWGQRRQRQGLSAGWEEGSCARPCDSLHTQVSWNNSRFPWITAGIVWHWGRNQRGKGKTSSFSNIHATVCCACKAGLLLLPLWTILTIEVPSLRKWASIPLCPTDKLYDLPVPFCWATWSFLPLSIKFFLDVAKV